MTTINHSARVGVITDQIGALSFMGIANVDVAKMVIDDLNDRGGQSAPAFRHASVSITLDIYSHVIPDMQQDAAAIMADVLERPSEVL
jgi:hypothetical protein